MNERIEKFLVKKDELVRIRDMTLVEVFGSLKTTWSEYLQSERSLFLLKGYFDHYAVKRENSKKKISISMIFRYDRANPFIVYKGITWNVLDVVGLNYLLRNQKKIKKQYFARSLTSESLPIAYAIYLDILKEQNNFKVLSDRLAKFYQISLKNGFAESNSLSSEKIKYREYLLLRQTNLVEAMLQFYLINIDELKKSQDELDQMMFEFNRMDKKRGMRNNSLLIRWALPSSLPKYTATGLAGPLFLFSSPRLREKAS